METIAENSSDEISAVVHVNCLYSSLLTRYMVPILAETAKEKSIGNRAAIINLSSIAGLKPLLPLNAIYSASKAFNNIFSQCLSIEVAHLGIDALAVCPGIHNMES